MINSMEFHPLSFNASVWVKTLELVFEHCQTQIPTVVGTFDPNKQCYWVACATYAVLQKSGIPSVLTGGHAVQLREKDGQTIIHNNWCFNLPSLDEKYEGHCWVETDNYIVDFSNYWFYKRINDKCKTSDLFIHKDKLLTLDDIAFEQKIGSYYASIPEYINAIEQNHQTMDSEYIKVVSDPVYSVFKNTFINIALSLYSKFNEDYLIAETIQ